MRSLLISMVAAALFAGCMNYPYHRQPRRASQGQAAPDAQVPPGKMLVQDLRTGNLILIDDPNWDGTEVEPAPRPEPAPRAHVSVPLPRLPSPRALPRPRIHLPPVPELPPLPGTFPAKKQPQFEISLEAFAFDITGSVYGHADLPYDSANLEGDLGIEDGAGVTLNLSLALPRGAKFRAGISALMAEGREMNPLVYGDPGFVAEIDVTILDLAFTPLAYYGNWGGLSMEAGVRYVRSNVSILESDRHAEGVMVLLGGGLDFNLYQDILSGTVAGSLGVGTDAFSIEFETGLRLKASPHFQFSLTYKLMAMTMADSSGEPDERALSFGAAGPALELALKF